MQRLIRQACSTSRMGLDDVILSLVAITIVVVVAGTLWTAAQRASKRRARRRQYRQAEYERRMQRRTTQPAPLSPGISRERANAVRRDAENWAQEVASGRAAEPRNPHPQGSQEFVLWITSYHLRLTELSEHDRPEAQAF
jgi:FtsZ-interacting cell division protein ZipA